MLEASRRQILRRLRDRDLVLDVGGWAQPFARADWVIDLLPHATRGLYGYEERDRGGERFSARTWVQRDMCAREPWPFSDGQFDFAICSHTLEDVRDPIWVCSELARVARAGYVEVPSRLDEQSWGVQGPWVGWGHHHWLCEVLDGVLQFVFKPHIVHARESDHFPAGFAAALAPELRVQTLWWQHTLPAHERVFVGAEEIDPYLADFVTRHLADAPAAVAQAGPRRRRPWRPAR